MNKKELIKKLDELAAVLDEIDTANKEVRDKIIDAKDLVENLPAEADEIEEDPKDE